MKLFQKYLSVFETASFNHFAMSDILKIALGVVIAIVAVTFLWTLLKWAAILIGVAVIAGFVWRVIGGETGNAKPY